MRSDNASESFSDMFPRVGFVRVASCGPELQFSHLLTRVSFSRKTTELNIQPQGSSRGRDSREAGELGGRTESSWRFEESTWSGCGSERMQMRA